jgi:hypothetical protein
MTASPILCSVVRPIEHSGIPKNEECESCDASRDEESQPKATVVPTRQLAPEAQPTDDRGHKDRRGQEPPRACAGRRVARHDLDEALLGTSREDRTANDQKRQRRVQGDRRERIDRVEAANAIEVAEE